MPATTTPVKQKAAAQKSVADKSAALKKEHAAKLKAIAKEKAAAPPKPKRDRSKWSDATGHIIEKGVTVKVDGKPIGTASYFHTHQIDGAPVGMVGVKLTGKGDTLKVGGRSVRNRSYRADELTAVPE